MNLIEWLKAGDNFEIVFKDTVYNSNDILLYTYSVAHEIQKSCKEIDDKYLVFFPRNNLETFVFYCVNSLLKTTAFICTKENIGVFFDIIPEDKTTIFIAAKGISVPNRATYNVSIDDAINFPNKFIKEQLSCIVPHYGEQAKFIFTTSGTTGNPKLILYSENKLIKNAEAVAEYLSLNERSVSICIFPMQYMYGLSTSLCALLSNSKLHFLQGYNREALCEYISHSAPTVLPILGDWLIGLSESLAYNKLRVPFVLNASDKLLTSQAKAILPYCDVLWNNFGQTESGPRIFFNKLESVNDIEQRSLNEVVAPGFVMNGNIKTSITDVDNNTGFGELLYSSPYSMDGYLDNKMKLVEKNQFFKSGDIFKIDEKGCHFWIRRKKEDLKVNGKFFPSSKVLNDFACNIGPLKAIFSKNMHGELVLSIETEEPLSNVVLRKMEEIIRKYWKNSEVHIKAVAQLKRTPSGKIRLAQ